MATVNKGILCRAGEWWKYLRWTKRTFWKRHLHRAAAVPILQSASRGAFIMSARTTASLFGVALALTVTAAPAAEYVIYTGTGVRECRHLTQTFGSPVIAEESDRDLANWIGGYLTGTSEADAGNMTSSFDNEVDVLVASVKSYCRSHPTEKVAVAVSAVVHGRLK
jgi:hypothetical protein